MSLLSADMKIFCMCEASREAEATLQVLMSRPREETRSDVAARYRALEQFSKEDARVQFLRILRSLPYGRRASSICTP